MREPFIAAYIDKGVWWSTYKCALWAILVCGWPFRASDLLAGPPATNDWKKTHLFFFSYLLLCFCGRPPIPKSMFIFGFSLMRLYALPLLFARRATTALIHLLAIYESLCSTAQTKYLLVGTIVTSGRQKRGNRIKSLGNPYDAFTTYFVYIYRNYAVYTIFYSVLHTHLVQLLVLWFFK